MNEQEINRGTAAPRTPGENPEEVTSAETAEQSFRLAKARKAAGARIALLDTEAALLYEMSPEESVAGRANQAGLPGNGATDER